MKTEYTSGPWIVGDDLTIRSRDYARSQQMGDYRGCIIADLKPALGVSSDTPQGIAMAIKVRGHAAAETG